MENINQLQNMEHAAVTPSTHPAQPLWHRFVAGGVGDMVATLFTHPLDVLKVKLQLQGELDSRKVPLSPSHVFRTARDVCGREGIARGMYRGLSAALLRQSLFSSARHGMYGIFVGSMMPMPAGLLAGCASAAATNPTDVVLVRMQQGTGPPPYRTPFHGFVAIARSDRVRGLWRGVGPTVTRAGVLTSTQAPVYELAKRTGAGEFLASVVSAVSCALVITPVDTVRTRMMRLGPKYRGVWSCVMLTVRTEGCAACSRVCCR